ncbi:hypothetical protein BDV06DRAFT_4877 [Aspergillus oleicola]
MRPASGLWKAPTGPPLIGLARPEWYGKWLGLSQIIKIHGSWFVIQNKSKSKRNRYRHAIRSSWPSTIFLFQLSSSSTTTSQNITTAIARLAAEPAAEYRCKTSGQTPSILLLFLNDDLLGRWLLVLHLLLRPLVNTWLILVIDVCVGSKRISTRKGNAREGPEAGIR